MYKYFGWMLAFLTSLTLTAAYANNDATDHEQRDTEAVEQDENSAEVVINETPENELSEEE